MAQGEEQPGRPVRSEWEVGNFNQYRVKIEQDDKGQSQLSLEHYTDTLEDIALDLGRKREFEADVAAIEKRQLRAHSAGSSSTPSSWDRSTWQSAASCRAPSTRQR